MFRQQMNKRTPVALVFCFGIFTGILTVCIILVLFFWKQENIQDTKWLEELKRNSFDKLNYFVDEGYNERNTGINRNNQPLTADDQSKQNMMKYRYEKKGEEVAKEIENKVQVLCWIATLLEHHKTKASAIRDTWGKRCNILLFMSSADDPSLPAIKLNVSDGRDHLYVKTKEAMKYIYKYYLNKVDWILKADDDTFVVIENLRFILMNHDASDPLYLGCRFRPYVKQGFMSGGAGYVLSRKALKMFVEEGLGSEGKCSKIKKIAENGEDVQLGRCLEVLNVTAVDTRDDKGRGRFFPYSPAFHLFPDHSSPAFQWYWNYQYYHNAEGIDCCSDTAVSFHYIDIKQLHVLDYLIYTLQPYGTSLYNQNVLSKTIVI